MSTPTTHKWYSATGGDRHPRIVTRWRDLAEKRRAPEDSVTLWQEVLDDNLPPKSLSTFCTDYRGQVITEDALPHNDPSLFKTYTNEAYALITIFHILEPEYDATGGSEFRLPGAAWSTLCLPICFEYDPDDWRRRLPTFSFNLPNKLCKMIRRGTKTSSLATVGNEEDLLENSTHKELGLREETELKSRNTSNILVKEYAPSTVQLLVLPADVKHLTVNDHVDVGSSTTCSSTPSKHNINSFQEVPEASKQKRYEEHLLQGIQEHIAHLKKERVVEDSEQLERHCDACLTAVRRALLHMKAKPARDAVDRAILCELRAQKGTLEKRKNYQSQVKTKPEGKYRVWVGEYQHQDFNALSQWSDPNETETVADPRVIPGFTTGYDSATNHTMMRYPVLLDPDGRQSPQDKKPGNRKHRLRNFVGRLPELDTENYYSALYTTFSNPNTHYLEREVEDLRRRIDFLKLDKFAMEQDADVQAAFAQKLGVNANHQNIDREIQNILSTLPVAEANRLIRAVLGIPSSAKNGPNEQADPFARVNELSKTKQLAQSEVVIEELKAETTGGNVAPLASKPGAS